MAIGVALMLIVVLALFGGALWQYSMAEMKRVERTEQDMQALFLARAGAEAVMGVWLDPEQSRPELPISIDPIYYNSAEGLFSSLIQPEEYLGVIEVTIKKEDYVYDDEVTEVTVIESVATVGSIERTARLMTYPHRYGHDLAWYSDQTGRIYSPASPARSAPNELIVMRTNPAGEDIYIGQNSVISSPRRIPLEAGHLVFESPLHLAKNTDNLKTSPSGDVDVDLMAEIIFLNGLEIAYMEGLAFSSDKNYSLVLKLPSGENRGQKGSEIKGNIAGGQVLSDNHLYGEIYFDAEPVVSEKFSGWVFLFWSGINLDETYTLGLKNKAFYFKDGTRLDPKAIYEHVSDDDESHTIASYFEQMADAGLLLPIGDEAQLSRDELEEIQPFFWNQ